MKDSTKTVVSLIMTAWFIVNFIVSFMIVVMVSNLVHQSIFNTYLPYNWEMARDFYVYGSISMAMHYIAWIIVLKWSTGKDWNRCIILPALKLIKLPVILREKMIKLLNEE